MKYQQTMIWKQLESRWEKKSSELSNGDFQDSRKSNLPRGPGARTQGESNPGQKGLRDRISPTCTLSQNGYGVCCMNGPGLRRAFKMPPLLLTSSPATQSSPAKHKEHKSPATHKQPRYA